MRKKLLSIIAVIVSALFVFSAFSGCNLLTVDNERDMAQVVATVKIADDAPTYEIKKKEMVMLYLNYGYSYVQQGYSSEETFNMILDNLINNKIMIQTAIQHFRGDNGEWDAKLYLNDDEKVKAEYNTIKYMNEFIDSYEQKDGEKKYESFSGDERTAPTDAEKAEEKLSTDEMKAYNEKYATYGADVGTPGSTRYKAYNKLLKVLEDNGLLGEDVKVLKDTDYFNDTLKSNQESLLVEKYENAIKAEARSKISFENLVRAYEDMYNAQVNKIVDVAAFESALSSATAKNPVVYTPYTGYIYVYNLLLGASDEQAKLIEKLDSDEDDYYEKLNAILSSTTVKDQRSSWIHSGYDFDIKTNKFTGDYAFLSDSIPFQGEVELINDDDKTDKKYDIKSVKEFGLDEFIEFMDGYVYGETQTDVKGNNADKYIKKVVNSNMANADYDKRINELLFAFSTDPGSLNTYKGYLVSPEPEIGGTETYVKEFAKAGRLFLEKDLGDKSYVMVATQYGYHVLFFSQKLDADSNFDTLVKYLNYTSGTEKDADGWTKELADLLEKWNDDKTDKKSYLYTIVDLLSDAENVYTEHKSSILNKYKNDENYVVKYTSRYQDLLDLS